VARQGDWKAKVLIIIASVLTDR